MQFDRVQSAIHERSLTSQYLEKPDINQPDAMRLWHHFGSSINKKILAEIHLFFISVDNTKDMMNVILSEDKLVHLKESLGKYIHSIEHYTHGRNTFEHFDDRIPGGAKHNKVKEIKKSGAGPRRNMGGLRGNVYTFGDKEWELSPNEFQKIIKLCYMDRKETVTRQDYRT